jgi:hypothetical protein
MYYALIAYIKPDRLVKLFLPRIKKPLMSDQIEAVGGSILALLGWTILTFKLGRSTVRDWKGQGDQMFTVLLNRALERVYIAGSPDASPFAKMEFYAFIPTMALLRPILPDFRSEIDHRNMAPFYGGRHVMESRMLLLHVKELSMGSHIPPQQFPCKILWTLSVQKPFMYLTTRIIRLQLCAFDTIRGNWMAVLSIDN